MAVKWILLLNLKWNWKLKILCCTWADLAITSIVDYDDTAFGTGTLTWQDPVHSWKAGPGEVMTAGNKQTNVTAEVLELLFEQLWVKSIQYDYKTLPLLEKKPTTSFQGYKLFLDQTSYYLTLNKLEVNENAWMH